MLNLKKLLTKVLTIEKGTATPSSGWTLSPNSYVRKICGVCEMYLELTNGTYASSGWNTVATLPRGFYPISYFDTLLLDNGSSVMTVDVKITTTGDVQVYKNSTLSSNLRLHTMFICGRGTA